jgi:hypothetical protein
MHAHARTQTQHTHSLPLKHTQSQLWWTVERQRLSDPRTLNMPRMPSVRHIVRAAWKKPRYATAPAPASAPARPADAAADAAADAGEGGGAAGAQLVGAADTAPPPTATPVRTAAPAPDDDTPPAAATDARWLCCSCRRVLMTHTGLVPARNRRAETSASEAAQREQHAACSATTAYTSLIRSLRTRRRWRAGSDARGRDQPAAAWTARRRRSEPPAQGLLPRRWRPRPSTAQKRCSRQTRGAPEASTSVSARSANTATQTRAGSLPANYGDTARCRP